MFAIATLNVQSLPLMPHEHVVHDVRLAAEKADVIFWQEIHPSSYRKAITDLGAEWDHHMPTEGGSPVSWRTKKFHLIETGNDLLHEAKAGVCMQRDITWVRLRRKGSLKQVVFHSVHYVPRAWAEDGTSRHRAIPQEAAEQPMRQRIWREGNVRHKVFIAKWINRGVTVVGGGDFNRGGETAVVGTTIAGVPVQYLDVTGGIDYLFGVPAQRMEIVRFSAESTPVFSDHPLKTAVIAVRRKFLRRK